MEKFETQFLAIGVRLLATPNLKVGEVGEAFLEASLSGLPCPDFDCLIGGKVPPKTLVMRLMKDKREWRVFHQLATLYIAACKKQ